MRTKKILASLAAATVALSGLAAGEAGDAHVDLYDVHVSSDGTTLTIEGALSYGGAVLVADDATGDATAPGLGLDLSTATIEQDGRMLTFTLGIADQIPGAGTLPDNIRYAWPVGLTDSFDDFELGAWASNAWETAQGHQGLTPFFSLDTFGTDETTGNPTFDSAPVNGTMGDGVVSWTLPVSMVGGNAGDALVAGSRGALKTGTGTVGFLQWSGSATVHDDSAVDADFVIGGLVTLTIRDWTTGDIMHSDSTLDVDGSFAFELDDLVGDYEIELTSSYGDLTTTYTTYYWNAPIEEDPCMVDPISCEDWMDEGDLIWW